MNDQEQIDALKAQVNCLREIVLKVNKPVLIFEQSVREEITRSLEATPEQCLAEVKAKAIEVMMTVIDRSTDAMSPLDVAYVFEIEEYVSKLRDHENG